MSRGKYKPGIPWGAGMISGVEFVCKVRPPEIPALPEHLSRERTSTALKEEYLFNTEHEVLYRAEQCRLQEAEVCRKMSEEAAAHKLGLLQQQHDEKEARDREIAESKERQLHTAFGLLQAHSANQILTPMRGNDNPLATTLPKDLPASRNHNNLLQDFDRADNPFDAAELNTINDLEELRDLLHQSTSVATFPSTQAPATAQANIPSHNSATSQQQPPQPPPPPPRIHEIYFPQLPTTANCARTPTPLLPVRQSPSPQAPRFPPASAQTPSSTYSTREQSPLSNYSTVVFDSIMDSPPSLSKINGCKPTPNPRLQHSPQTVSKTASFPDPYDQLDAQHRLLVDRAVSIGFPRGQSARFISAQVISGDSSKTGPSPSELEQPLMNHLTSVADLESTGIPASEAEPALQLFPNEPNQALKFIRLSRELLEFGFSTSAIHEALLTTHLDRERAVYLLQSQAP